MKQRASRLDELQAIAEAQKNEMAKIEGRIESLMEDLKEEGYTSVEKAQIDLAELNKKLKTRSKIFDKKLEEFEKKYADKIQKNT